MPTSARSPGSLVILLRLRMTQRWMEFCGCGHPRSYAFALTRAQALPNRHSPGDSTRAFSVKVWPWRLLSMVELVALRQVAPRRAA